MLYDYETIVVDCIQLERIEFIAKLDALLPAIWAKQYGESVTSSLNLLTVSFGATDFEQPFCRFMFDHLSASKRIDVENPEVNEDRVVAVWGTSKPIAIRPRDQSRMRGLLQHVWISRFPKTDRGHFFAHTMGGGLDINLFPQSAQTNRRGLWRKMENYCAKHPGTFCFVRPIYSDKGWRPLLLEYGIVKMTPDTTYHFWGNVFEN